MINYSGFAKAEDPKKRCGLQELSRFKGPYHFHYEDYTGEELYGLFLPKKDSLKQFFMKILFFTIMILAMRAIIMFG